MLILSTAQTIIQRPWFLRITSKSCQRVSQIAAKGFLQNINPFVDVVFPTSALGNPKSARSNMREPRTAEGGLLGAPTNHVAPAMDQVRYVVEWG